MIARLLFALLLVAGLECEARSQTPSVIVMPVTQNGLDIYFDSIRIEDAKFTFVRRADGDEMTCVMGDEAKAASPGGSTFQVPLGTPFRLYNHVSEIKFIPLPGDHGVGGFLIEQLFVNDKIRGRQVVHAGFLNLSYDPSFPPKPPGVQLESTIRDIHDLARWETECRKPSDKTAEN